MIDKANLFKIIIIGHQIGVFSTLFFLADYSPQQMTNSLETNVKTIIFTSLMTLLGFILLTGISKKTSLIGITYSIFSAILAIQNYYLCTLLLSKTFLQINYDHPINQSSIKGLTLTNYNNDLQSQRDISSFSFLDGIACAIAVVVSYFPFIGKISLFQLYILSFIVPVGFMVNVFAFHRFAVTDGGFGIRVFLYAGVVGIIGNLMFMKGKKKFIINRAVQYQNMIFGLIGAILIVSFFPSMATAFLYNTSTNNNRLLSSGYITFYMALFGSITATFSYKSIKQQKLSYLDIISGILIGFIVHSSLYNILFNPGISIGLGFLSVLIVQESVQYFFTSYGNSKGYSIYKIMAIQLFLLPGLISGVMTITVHLIGDIERGLSLHYRNSLGQGLAQGVGVGSVIVMGAIVGVVIGLIMKVIDEQSDVDDGDCVMANYEQVQVLKKQTKMQDGHEQGLEMKKTDYLSAVINRQADRQMDRLQMDNFQKQINSKVY